MLSTIRHTGEVSSFSLSLASEGLPRRKRVTLKPDFRVSAIFWRRHQRGATLAVDDSNLATLFEATS